MEKPRVFVTRKVDEAAIALLETVAAVEVWLDYKAPSKVEMLSKAQDVDAILANTEDRIDEDVLAVSNGRLKVVANMAVGFDNLDVITATRLGIAMSNTPGVLTKTTAELGFALMMAVSRQIVTGDRDVRDGKWQHWHPSAYLGVDLAGSTLSVIGMGKIGFEFAKRAKAFEMRVLYHNRSPRKDIGEGFEYCEKLETALEQADFLCITTPLTKETHHFIGKAQLSLMKPAAILINIARGAVVDNIALFEALKEGRIAGAGLDVTEPEPIPADHPLLTLANVVITPHIGSASQRTRRDMAVLAAQNIKARLSGEPMPSCVNPEAMTRKTQREKGEEFASHALDAELDEEV